jgi:multidrug resistance efflux pump
LTGAVAPVDTVSLSFASGGIVTSTNVTVGDTVNAGQVLATLNTNSLKAQLAGAKANVAIAKAKLKALSDGNSADTVAAAKTTLDEANQTLANNYQSAYQTLRTASLNADDAVRAKLNSYLLNPESAYPRPVFNTNAIASLSAAEIDRPIAGTELVLWKAELDKLSPSSPGAAIDIGLSKALAHFVIIQKYLTDMSDVAAYATAFPANDTVDTPLTLQTSVAASVSEANDAQTNIRNAQQTLGLQKIVVKQAEIALANATTPPKPSASDTATQQAQIDAAQAVVDQISAQINDSSLRAPIDGIISMQRIHAGETVSANTPLVTIISKDKLEVRASIPQAALGKVHLNDPVVMTFDAFPRENFPGVVAEIDPTETIVNGASQYKITVAFAKLDSRMKSGLVAKIIVLPPQTKK